MIGSRPQDRAGAHAHPAASAPVPDWALADRLNWLARFERLLARHRDELCLFMADEIGKPPFEGLTSDLMPLLAACRWLRRRAPRLLRPRPVRGRAWFQLGQRLAIAREPLGTVAIIATWNYPVQLLGIQLIQALVAGNRVIVKPSENAPRTQQRLLTLGVAAGLPDGALTWVEPTRDAGPRLLREHHVDHVVFTGSTRVGREVAAWAAGTLTPTTLELSGRDSALVLDDADPRLAARAIWNAVVTNAGQTCMAPRRALVDQRVYEAFLAALAPLAAGARPVCLIAPDPAARAFDLARDAVARGGRSLSGILEPPLAADPRRLRPLAIVDCPDSAPLVEGDHFAPILAVVPVRDLSHALALHARCTQHLATSVFTRRPARRPGLARALGAGIVLFNDCLLPVGHPGVALGGRGESGWGVSRGADGLLAMTRAVHVTSTHPRLRTPLAPPTTAMVRTISSLVGRWYGASRATPAPPLDPADPVVPDRSPAPATPRAAHAAAHDPSGARPW
jgi:aldehyde dehydrogenase (NAD+)